MFSKGWTEYYISEQAKVGERVSIEDGKFIVYACDVKDAKNAPLSILDDVEEDGSRYVLSRYIREKKNRKEDVGPSAYFVFEKMSGKVFERYCNKLLAKEQFVKKMILALFSAIYFGQ